MNDTSWTTYYEGDEGRSPWELLLRVLATFAEPGDAVDLGCGAGIDTLAMLERGWSVFATDAEPEAIARLKRRVGTTFGVRLRLQQARMEDVRLRRADLVWAGFSLFFCDPGRFPALWERIGAATRAGGRFAGQLLGERDSWAGGTDITSFGRSGAEAMFDGWAVERFDEEEHDGDAFSGPKHWHVFHVVALKSAAELLR